MPTAEPGDLKFVDLNGDGKLGEEDRTMIGNPHPDFTFGLTLSGEYKGFDLSMFFQGSVGNDILNILKYDIYSGTGWYNAPKDIFDKFWTGPGSTNENFAISANSRDNLTMSVGSEINSSKFETICRCSKFVYDYKLFRVGSGIG